MVSPHPPTNETDRCAREDHKRVAKQRLLGKDRQHFGHDAKGREHEDVHLGMTKDPEQVLPEQRICTKFNREEGGIK